MKPRNFLILIILILLIVGGGAYYFLFLFDGKKSDIDPNVDINDPKFNPFPTPSTNTGTSTPIDTNNNGSSTDTVNLPRLRLIWSDPISGMSATSTGSSTIIRFVDRGLGYIMESRSDGAEIRRLTGRTLPQIYEAYWDKNSSAFVALLLDEENPDTVLSRYLKINEPIKPKTSTVKPSTSTSTVSTSTPEVKNIEQTVSLSFVNNDIKSVSFPSKKVSENVFAYLKTELNGSSLNLHYPSTNKIIKIFDSPFEYWNISWFEKDKILMTSFASGYTEGYSYVFDNTKKTFTKTLSGRGLSTTAGNESGLIAYSLSGKDRMRLFIKNLKNNSSTETLFSTLAEKCVWGTKIETNIYCGVPAIIPNAMYPDDWYKGKVSTMDKIWKYNTETGEAELVGDLYSLSNKEIDVYRPIIDPKENYIIFMNKKDLSLWSLELK